MRLRDVDGWPPVLIDSQSFRVTPANTVPATYLRCGIYSIAGSPHPYLGIVVSFQGRTLHASLQDLPEPLLRRIERTLHGHEGEPLAALGSLELL